MKSRFKKVYLLQGQEDNSGEVVKTISKILAKHAGVQVAIPHIPEYEEMRADVALKVLQDNISHMEPNSLLVGISLGGLLAAALQEANPEHNFNVFAISSYTSDVGVMLMEYRVQRISLFSSLENSLFNDWRKYTPYTYDVPWLQHGPEISKYTLSHLIYSYLNKSTIRKEIEELDTYFPEFDFSTSERVALAS